MAAIDIDNSWLSDHPLIKLTVGAKHDQKNLGVFNVLSDIASRTGINAQKIDEKAEKLYSCLAYIEENTNEFGSIIQDVLEDNKKNGPFSVKEHFQSTEAPDVNNISNPYKTTSITNLFSYTPGVGIVIGEHLSDKNIQTLNDKLKARLLKATGKGSEFKPKNITFKNIFDMGVLEGDAITNYLYLCNELNKKINGDGVTQLTEDQVFLDKTGKKKSYELKSIHQYLIDTILKTGCMGGFEYHKEKYIELEPKKIKIAKDAFLETQIDDFFTLQSGILERGILVCPEFDQISILDKKPSKINENIKHVKLGYHKDIKRIVETQNKLVLGEGNKIEVISTESFVTGSEMEMKSNPRKYNPNDFSNNFCRVVFYQGFDLRYHECLSINTLGKPGKDKFMIDFLIFQNNASKKYLICFSVHLNSVPIDSFEKENKYGEIRCVVDIIEQKLKKSYLAPRLGLREKRLNLSNLDIYILGDFNYPIMNKQNSLANEPTQFMEVKPLRFNQEPDVEELQKSLTPEINPVEINDFLTEKNMVENGNYLDIFNQELAKKNLKMLTPSQKGEENEIYKGDEFNGKAAMPKRRPFSLTNAQVEKADSVARVYNTDFIFKIEELKKGNTNVFDFAISSYEVKPDRSILGGVEKFPCFRLSEQTRNLLETKTINGPIRTRSFGSAQLEASRKANLQMASSSEVGENIINSKGIININRGGYKKKSRKKNKKNLKSLKNTPNNLRKSKRRNHKRTNKR